MKRRIPTWDDFLFERTIEQIPHKPKKWFEVKPEDYADVEDDFFQLIQTAYKEVGGHVKIKEPDDVFTSGWNYWVAVDIDADIDVEIVKGYKVTQFGYKSAVVGHDDSKQAKQEYLKKFAKDLKIKGQYVEVSHKIAQILINKYNVHIVDNPDAIEAVVGKPGNPIKFYGKHPTDSSMPGEGWYERKIAGKPIIKTLVGRPLVKESANPENPTLLVLHGYESSVYPQRLKDLSKDYNIINPPMDYENVSNLFAKTLKVVQGKKIDMIVGSSMGGYFGYYMAKKLNVPALLFNPAVIQSTSGIKRQKVDMSGSSNPKMIIVSGNNDTIIPQDDLEKWLKENGKNYKFIKENMGHQIPDDLYIKYVNKYA